MTPMIDVVFLLLVFFVWTASFQLVERVLPSAVSESTPAQPADADTPPPPEADFHDVVVRILWASNAPRWLLNEQPCADLASLRGRLVAIHSANAQAPVIIHPDSDTPLGYVIEVYDVSRQVGFDKIQFAVSQDA